MSAEQDGPIRSEVLKLWGASPPRVREKQKVEILWEVKGTRCMWESSYCSLFYLVAYQLCCSGCDTHLMELIKIFQSDSCFAATTRHDTHIFRFSVSLTFKGHHYITHKHKSTQNRRRRTCLRIITFESFFQHHHNPVIGVYTHCKQDLLIANSATYNCAKFVKMTINISQTKKREKSFTPQSTKQLHGDIIIPINIIVGVSALILTVLSSGWVGRLSAVWEGSPQCQTLTTPS